MGFGQRANCRSKPTAPRFLGCLGVRMMLFLLSRNGRTSTTPPCARPEGSRHHFGSVLCPTLETVIVSQSFIS